MLGERPLHGRVRAVSKKEFDGPIRARVLRKVAALEDDPGHLVPLGWLVLTIYGAFGSGTTAWSTRSRIIASW
jgi:hypothetical protein